MRIVFDGIPITNADSRAEPPPSNFTWPTSYTVQVEPGTRSQNRRVFPRANETHQIGFDVKYEKSSIGQATAWIAQMKSDLRSRKGDLEIYLDGSSGSSDLIICSGAAAVQCNGTVVGRTAIIVFSFVFESFQTSEP